MLGGINLCDGSYLGWLPNLEEEWLGGWFMLVVEIILEDLSFNADGIWKNDEEMGSCEVLHCVSVLDFEVLSLKIIMDV